MFKTILVHADLSSHAPARMHYAAALARLHGARLVGAAMLGVSRVIFPQGYDTKPGTLSASYFDPLADNARRALSHFEAIARKAQVAHESRFVCDQADDGLALLARFADLVVLSQDDPTEAMPDMAVHLPEYVILNCARPVLLVPRIDPPPIVDHKVLVAWNGSKEASCALSAAVPALRHATEVHVATLASADDSESDLLAQHADLGRFLGQHRITPRFVLRQGGPDSGRALLALAHELRCGTLVMGCFGHSRFRELCLGGASRTVMADADLPVLLAH
jgi:nucleotide-binding universal stress UspA family protein